MINYKALLLALILSPSLAFGFGAKPPKEESPSPAPDPTPTPNPPPSQNPGNIPAPSAGSEFTSCYNKLASGNWSWGGYPAGCNVSPAQSAPFAKAQYAPVIMNDGNTPNAYMNEIYLMARKLGTYYLKRRNPNVSNAELEGFLAGFYALLNQETFFTHYRFGTDSILRYMRGDSLHGYGIMQVDDRSHSVALNQGKGVDLVENMIYGLDIFYSNWVKSASSACVSSTSNYEQRARAAWSAYNGGPAKLCRWANASDPNAAKDQQYIGKYRAEAWLKYVPNPIAGSPMNVVCLSEGTRPCAMLE